MDIELFQVSFLNQLMIYKVFKTTWRTWVQLLKYKNFRYLIYIINCYTLLFWISNHLKDIKSCKKDKDWGLMFSFVWIEIHLKDWLAYICLRLALSNSSYVQALIDFLKTIDISKSVSKQVNIPSKFLCNNYWLDLCKEIQNFSYSI